MLCRNLDLSRRMGGAGWDRRLGNIPGYHLNETQLPVSWATIKCEKQKTAFSNPDPFVHDTFTIWRFIEYDVGIIAASLPSLKPLFKRVLNGTRGTTPSGPNKLRYSIRPEPSDDEMPLEGYHGKAGNSVAISSKRSLPVWRPTSGNNSSESIRTLEPNAVLVETKWRVS
jgi:hypothetical protein